MQLGLIGYPLGHSKSPEIFKELFTKNGVEGKYSLLPLDDINSLGKVLNDNPLLKGFNVTIPHKKTIIPLLDEVSNEAKAIGAVNTVKISRSDGDLKLVGYNTDYYGFKTSLVNFLGEVLPTKALILGTGGSANTVAAVLENLNVSFTFISRTASKAKQMGYQELSKTILEEYLLIINTTPVGMFPNIQQVPQIPYEFITKHHYLFDLVYNPTQTEFLRRGEAKGAHTKNGLEMLYLQAEKAYDIFTK